ncbi:magnesium transporter MgtE N-terminal domain-containing protein [Alkalilimnicola ehrlichii]|uniref:magnesium transporter MgtE N-terminal domain-containing protein n=1 Tax=Alkalilimnicola ehrlichii TaxID=351052 RepID=UPI003BA2C2D5
MFESIIENLRLGRYGQAMDLANRLQDDELSRLVQEVDSTRARLLFRRLPPKRQRALFFSLDLPNRRRLLAALEPSEAAELALPLPTHEQVRLLEECPRAHSQTLLRRLHPEQRHALRRALEAPANGVTRWMRGLPPLITAGAPGRAACRRLSRSRHGDVLLVVDGKGLYLGLTTGASLAALADEKPVEQGVVDSSWHLRPDDGLRRARRYFKRSGLPALPVLDAQHRVVGVLAAADLRTTRAAGRTRGGQRWLPGRLALASVLFRGLSVK